MKISKILMATLLAVPMSGTRITAQEVAAPVPQQPAGGAAQQNTGLQNANPIPPVLGDASQIGGGDDDDSVSAGSASGEDDEGAASRMDDDEDEEVDATIPYDPERLKNPKITFSEEGDYSKLTADVAETFPALVKIINGLSGLTEGREGVLEYTERTEDGIRVLETRVYGKLLENKGDVEESFGRLMASVVEFKKATAEGKTADEIIMAYKEILNAYSELRASITDVEDPRELMAANTTDQCAVGRLLYNFYTEPNVKEEDFEGKTGEEIFETLPAIAKFDVVQWQDVCDFSDFDNETFQTAFSESLLAENGDIITSTLTEAVKALLGKEDVRYGMKGGRYVFKFTPEAVEKIGNLVTYGAMLDGADVAEAYEANKGKLLDELKVGYYNISGKIIGEDEGVLLYNHGNTKTSLKAGKKEAAEKVAKGGLEKLVVADIADQLGALGLDCLIPGGMELDEKGKADFYAAALAYLKRLDTPINDKLNMSAGKFLEWLAGEISEETRKQFAGKEYNILSIEDSGYVCGYLKTVLAGKDGKIRLANNLGPDQIVPAAFENLLKRGEIDVFDFVKRVDRQVKTLKTKLNRMERDADKFTQRLNAVNGKIDSLNARLGMTSTNGSKSVMFGGTPKAGIIPPSAASSGSSVIVERNPMPVPSATGGRSLSAKPEAGTEVKKPVVKKVDAQNKGAVSRSIPGLGGNSEEKFEGEIIVPLWDGEQKLKKTVYDKLSPADKGKYRKIFSDAGSRFLPEQ